MFIGGAKINALNSDRSTFGCSFFACGESFSSGAVHSFTLTLANQAALELDCAATTNLHCGRNLDNYNHSACAGTHYVRPGVGWCCGDTWDSHVVDDSNRDTAEFIGNERKV